MIGKNSRLSFLRCWNPYGHPNAMASKILNGGVGVTEFYGVSVQEWLPELLKQLPAVRQDADDEDRNDEGMEP